MRINELKIFGFKSFANKTSIRFDNNFVGIVGPNGSGKSNIIDAVRWVFGEQSSKSLRGENSKDVIFGGTQTKKAMNFAEVTLVLDNSDQHLPLDYSEISLTRRVYRNGDGEYMINNIECRLKDITDLIMDSGMGKTSFSIISQGKIEEIVMSKPDKRRVVVEEVAGVLKYKSRKEAAIKKLDKTHYNLEQIDLILNEMNTRLVPLKRQSEKAIEYFELKKKLTDFEVTLLSNRISKNNIEFQGLTQIIDSSTIEIQKITNEINILENDEYLITQNINEEYEKLSSIKLKHDQLRTLVSRLESQLLLMEQKQLHNASTKIEQQVANLNQKINTQELNLNENKIQMNKHEILYNQIKLKLKAKQELIDNTRNKKFKLDDLIHDKKNSSASLKSPYAVRQVLNKFDDVNIIRDLFDVNGEYANAISTAIGGRANEIVFDSTDQIKKAINFLNETKSGRATFIPLDNVKQFFIEGKLRESIETSQGFINYAINLIEFEDKYKTAFNNLLQTTIVVDNLENANMIAAKIYNRYKIVTLQGEIVSTVGTISGGNSKSVNAVVIKQEIKKLNELIIQNDLLYDKLRIEIIEIENKYNEVRLDFSHAKQNCDNLEKSIQNLNFELNDLLKDKVENNDQNNLHLKLKSSREKFNELEFNINEIEEKVKQLNLSKQDKSLIQKECNSNLRKINSDLSEYKIESARLEILLKQDFSVLSEEYQMSYEMSNKVSKNSIDIELYETEVLKIKRKIKNLGIVNTDAIEEYTEIKLRFDFIDVQKNDLVLAKNKLLSIISKLDLIVEKQFKDSFYKLKSEFEIIYKELFGGGNAQLVLTQPNDYLNTGIEIIAQPPGKKLQTISLLSGGEKALTAIALLFSILRVRTVPFAILDEVEAALDEANVKRYARYLQVFSEHTQFLVITHRQGTMEIVDELYGVTMAEKGVSSIVNVKLNEIGGKDE